MKILITGSEGFVGKVLVANLLASDQEIEGIDRVKADNLSYRLHRTDLRNEVLLDPASYDVVIHCAAAKGDWNISDEEFYEDNVVATENLLNYVRKCEIKKIIHL